MLALSKATEQLTKAQRLYVKLCNSNKARPDAGFLKALPDQMLQMYAIDMCDEKELDIIGILCSRMTATEHIDLRCRNGGLTLAPGSEPPRHKHGAQVGQGDKDEVPIQTPGPCLKVCKSISKCIMQSKGLLTLNIEGVILKPETLRVLGKAVLDSLSLKRFGVSRCNIGDDGLTAIASSLVGSLSITDIDLSGNSLHDVSASRLAAIISRHSSRRDDEYWASCLRSGGEEGLVPRGPNPSDAEIAVQLNGLVALDLSGNNLSDRTVKYLSEALERDDWLVALNLLDNDISSKGKDALMNSLELNESLAAIDFRPKVKLSKHFHDLALGTSKLRPSVSGDLPAPMVRLVKRDPKTAGWMMTRAPKKGIPSTHPTIYAILARWGWFGIIEGAAAKQINTKKAKKRPPKKGRTLTATGSTRMSKHMTQSSADKSKETISISRAISSNVATGSGGVKRTFQPRKRSEKVMYKGDFASTPSALKLEISKRKSSTKTKTKVAKVVLPRPMSAQVISVSHASPLTGHYERESLHGPETVIKGSDNRADLTAAARPKSARGRRRPLAVNLLGTERPLQSSTHDSDILNLALSTDAIHALRAVFRTCSDSGENGEPTASLDRLVTEIRNNADASALLNIPASTSPSDVPNRPSPRRMNWAMLVQFFDERSDNALRAANSPRISKAKEKKESPQKFTDFGGNVPVSPRVLLPDGTPGNTAAVLEQLEGWVSQMHTFMDRAEQDPSLINSGIGSRSKQDGRSPNIADSSGSTMGSGDMSPSEVRDAIASRLRDLFQLSE